MKPVIKLPVFALDEATTWEDLPNAMAASVEYQNTHFGKIFPLMCFAPMTEPEVLDAWEPMKSLPENLLLVSIERHIDKRLFGALKLAVPRAGEMATTESQTTVRIDFDKPLADVCHQMEKASLKAFAHPLPGKDDASFFFLLGAELVRAFSKSLPTVKTKK